MRDRVNRRQVLASASGALAFTALPKLPAVASIVAVPVSPPPSVSPLFDGLETLTDDLRAAIEKVLIARTGFVEGDDSLRQVFIQAIEGHAARLTLGL